MRWALLRELAPPALRSARLLPLAIGTALGSAVAVAPTLAGVELEAHDVVLLLRCSMVVMALGVAFVLDDPTGRTTEAVPVPRAWVSLLRCLAAVAVLGAAWAVQLAVAPLAVPAEARAALPMASLTLEPLALAAWALVLGSLGARFTAEGSGGILAGPGMILMAIAAMLLPEEAALFTQPQSEGWERSHWIWTALLATGTLGLGLLLREPRNRGRGWPGSQSRTPEPQPPVLADSA
ncbi:hypothetical protein ACH4TV_43300 [Streptomyces sp. NPDC020898]|uniref:hypothetical protein n=1 Tax=Streptomyces sp. NPDC020898 TaxID=3365101 RepID=UPI003792ADD1